MSRRRLRGIVQVGISAVLLFLILRSLDWRAVAGAVLGIDWRWLALAWGLFLLGVAVRAVRWQVLLQALGQRRPLAELARLYLVGSFFNVILPTGFGGDAVRVAELGQDMQRVGPALNSVLVDRYLGIMVLLLMGLVAGLAAPGMAPIRVMGLMGVLFLGGLLVAWLLVRPAWASLSQRRGRLGRVARLTRLPALVESVAAYDLATIERALVASFAFNVLQIAWNVAIAYGLGLRLGLETFLVFVPLTAVALLLPAFGGLGVRELSYIGLFVNAGVARPQAMALSLGVYIITVATGLVGGLLYAAQGLRRARASVTRGSTTAV